MEHRSFYFVDGFGTVYRINPETGKAKGLHPPRITNESRLQGADPSKRKAVSVYVQLQKPAKIESFDLKTEKTERPDHPKFKNIVTPKSHLKLYDVQVMDGF